MAAADILIYNTTAVAPAITGASLATGSARQSAVADFGTPRAATWLCRIAATYTAAPTALTKTLDVYIGYASATASANFPAGLGAADTTYTGYGTLANSVPQLEYVGTMVASNVATIQTADIGIIMPKLQYGQVVVVNNTDQALTSVTTAGVALSVTFTPIVDQLQ